MPRAEASGKRIPERRPVEVASGSLHDGAGRVGALLDLVTYFAQKGGIAIGFKCTDKSVYRFNYCYLYRYSDSLSRLVNCRCVREPGWEERRSNHVGKGKAGNDEKLANSISRTRSAVFELAMCNDWQFFVTLTLSPLSFSDRKDLKAVSKTILKFISNYNHRREGAEVRYLLIPERHKDLSWHFHGLMSGIPASDLHAFTLSERLPYKLLDKLRGGSQVFSWSSYSDKFGYCDLEPIRSFEGVSRYMTKYISKDLENSVQEQNAHLYYASHGLRRKTLIAEGYIKRDFVPDFENDFVRLKSAANPAELAKYLCD